MKTLLILLLSTMSLLSYSQTKEYYKHEGEIRSLSRSSNSQKYKCKKSGSTSRINNINNQLSKKVPFKKDGSRLTGDVLTQVVYKDPEIIHKISASVLKKYGFEIYTRKESFGNKSINPLNYFEISICHDSSNGKILEVEFIFESEEDCYASYLPIEAYEEIETEIKKQVKGITNEEGKTRIFCRQVACIYFKPKK